MHVQRISRVLCLNYIIVSSPFHPRTDCGRVRMLWVGNRCLGLEPKSSNGSQLTSIVIRIQKKDKHSNRIQSSPSSTLVFPLNRTFTMMLWPFSSPLLYFTHTHPNPSPARAQGRSQVLIRLSHGVKRRPCNRSQSMWSAITVDTDFVDYDVILPNHGTEAQLFLIRHCKMLEHIFGPVYSSQNIHTDKRG